MNKASRAGGLILLLILTVVIFAGFFSTYPPEREFRSHYFHPPVQIHWTDETSFMRWPTVNATIPADSGEPSYHSSSSYFPVRLFVRSWKYRIFGLVESELHLFGVEEPGKLFLLGTDPMGRDVWSRMLFGAQFSFFIALLAVLVSTTVGLVFGGLAGAFAGRTDRWITGLSEVLMAVPAVYLLLAVRGTFATKSPVSMYLGLVMILSLLGWTYLARGVRAIILPLRQQEYVLAAQVAGAGRLRILFRHLLPASFGHATVRSVTLLPAYILAEVSLGFLGLGIPEPAPSLGNMLRYAQDLTALQEFTWLLYPGVFLFLSIFSLNLVAEGMRDRIKKSVL